MFNSFLTFSLCIFGRKAKKKDHLPNSLHTEYHSSYTYYSPMHTASAYSESQSLTGLQCLEVAKLQLDNCWSGTGLALTRLAHLQIWITVVACERNYFGLVVGDWFTVCASTLMQWKCLLIYYLWVLVSSPSTAFIKTCGATVWIVDALYLLYFST